ncbi:protein kinase [Acidobacteriota bacterium]
MKCPKCQTHNPNDSKFCKECATSLKDIPEVSVTQTKTLHSPTVSPDKTFAGKYKIIEEIGRGGMGIVYKAEDTKLKRKVALKFLPAELMQDKHAKARFLQEAQAAAALNHPNICTVYEVDVADDQTFIAMEFIEGQTLKDKIDSGPLDIDDAVKITTQVAEGLAEAHAKGIVHRDIKPANIMLTDKGITKIMDFGIAKLATGVDLTQPSTLIGTVAYMSPEQARGDEVDLRTDIWSLGAIFYEMLTGERPFQKNQEHALIYEILEKDPPPISTLRKELPDNIEKVVNTALSKSLCDRYQNMIDLLQDLKESPGFAIPKAEKSIVVLPFENLSPEPDQEYFCDGMTEEIITDLSHIQDLLVISRISAMTFKGTKSTIKEIANKINVQYVLEGSVRKARNNLRITAQLIDANNDAHLWAEKYNGTLDDVFDIQEKVSRSIVDALKLKLTSDENKKIASSPIPNVYAYECFLKARHELWKWTEDGLNSAVIHLKKGLEFAGENAVLLAGMGYVYYQYGNTGIRTDELTMRKAEDYTKCALELDPESPNAHIVLALLLGWRGKPREGIDHFKRALAVEPNNFDALVWFPCFCSFLGKTEAAMPLVERLLKVEPLHPMSHFTFGMLHNMGGKFNIALDSLREAYKAYPTNHLIQWIFAQTLAYRQHVDEAYSVIDNLIKETPDDLLARLGFSVALALRHNESEALLILRDPKIEAWARPDLGQSFYVAEAYALLDHKKEALDWLENAVDRGFANYPFLNDYDPFLKNIRGEPRFKKLMERVKHEWENFEV